MTLADLKHIIWRWRIIIVAATVAAILAVMLNFLVFPAVYESTAKIQITLPQGEDVVLFEGYRAESSLDTLMVTRNNFGEVLESLEVKRRTAEQLGLSESDAEYGVEMEEVRDSNFIYVRVRAHSPQQAAQIADAHVANAIAYYGEIRAKPAATARAFFEEQLIAADAALREAEQELNAFQVKHSISELPQNITNTQSQISDLQSQRDLAIIERPTNRSVERIDALLAERQSKLNQLLALDGEYNRLLAKVERARAEQKLLYDAATEAGLKEMRVRTASFIQVIEPPDLPTSEAFPSRAILLFLGAFGGLGGGLLLAFLLEYLSRSATIQLPRAMDSPRRLRVPSEVAAPARSHTKH